MQKCNFQRISIFWKILPIWELSENWGNKNTSRLNWKWLKHKRDPNQSHSEWYGIIHTCYSCVSLIQEIIILNHPTQKCMLWKIVLSSIILLKSFEGGTPSNWTTIIQLAHLNLWRESHFIWDIAWYHVHKILQC